MSSKLPTVSIVVSAYNNASYLPATIDSILQQTYSDFEILVFSHDCHQFNPWFERQSDSRLKFILQSNLGLAATFNQGILEARGKYISIVEPGDLWHPSKLQKQVFFLDRYSQIDLVHSPSISIDRQSQGLFPLFTIDPTLSITQHAINTIQQPIKSWTEIEGKYSSINEKKSSEILAQNQLVSSSVMLRRSCFDRVGLFDPELQIIPTWEMWIRLSHHYEFMAIAEPLVYCRQLRESHLENWLKLETDLQTIIEKTYALLSPEREQQKQRSYSYASLFLAQYVLQHKVDPVIAHNYWYQALQHDPLIIFSSKFCQLRWLIFNLYCLQSDRYCNLLQSVQAVGDRLKLMVYKIREYSQKIVDWMLEEEDSINFWKNRRVKRQGKD